MPDAAPSILRASRFFLGVKGASFDRLAHMAQVRRFARGAAIFREGQECPGVFVVGSGLVRVFKTAPSGREHVLHLVAPGGTFAEVAAIAGFETPANAEALEDTVCALLPAPAFAQALQDDHQLCLQLMGSMAAWVKHLVGLLEDIALRDATGRLARYLLSEAIEPQDVVRLPSLKKHLASHLNLTSETLSRTLRRMSDAGAIESRDDQSLVIKSRAALEQWARGEFPQI
ncbi:MAG: Crp/Fnr family transcriptional regulator [Deltaproteobacteria bacterium]|nr:Crp/Fnr family transcriptional regulator [Deltaproteobacteria bacterium]